MFIRRELEPQSYEELDNLALSLEAEIGTFRSQRRAAPYHLTILSKSFIGRQVLKQRHNEDEVDEYISGFVDDLEVVDLPITAGRQLGVETTNITLLRQNATFLSSVGKIAFVGINLVNDKYTTIRYEKREMVDRFRRWVSPVETHGRVTLLAHITLGSMAVGEFGALKDYVKRMGHNIPDRLELTNWRTEI